MQNSAKTRKVAEPWPAPNKSLSAIAPYEQGKSDIPGHDNSIKLSSNEGCFGPSPKAAEAFLQVVSNLHRYPDGSQSELRKAIAGVHQLDADRIICGNGSEELIGLVMKCFLGAGQELLLSKNHFVMCSIYGKAQGAEIILVPEKDFVTDIDAVLARVSDKTKIIALANPNNPTGTYVPRMEVQRLIDSVPNDVLFLLDGAYAEYVDREDFDGGFGWVESNQNVVVTRTFSKIFGLAGLRIGWAYGPERIIEVLNRLRTPFNANSPAMAAAAAAIRDFDHVKRVVSHNRRWLDEIQDKLTTLGVNVVPSVANFYLLSFDEIPNRSTAEASQFLEDNGIIPRPAGGDHCLRLTVGNDDENQAVLDALTKYVIGNSADAADSS